MESLCTSKSNKTAEKKWALHALCIVALLYFHCPLAAFNELSKEKSALKYLM